MSATKQERLDELLGMAEHLGFMEATARSAEHRADMAPRGSTARPRREARELRTNTDGQRTTLARARTRFLADFGGAS